MNYEMTLFARIDWATYGLKTITVQEAIATIRDGTYYIDDSARSGMYGTLKDITAQIQQQPEGVDIQPVKQQFLPAVSFNGVYKKGIVKYSNVTALDFDHIRTQEEYSELYQRLIATPCVGWIYRTPSGKGVKALIIHDNTDPGMHGNMYQQLIDMFQTPNLKTDPKCKDLSRRNYLCYDPDAWTNPSPVPFHFEYDVTYDTATSSSYVYHSKQKQSITQHIKHVTAKGLPSDASVMSMLKSRCKRFHPEYLKEGARRDGVYWFGTQASKAGVDFAYGLGYVQNLYQSSEITLTRGGTFSEEEITVNFTNGYTVESYDKEFRKGFIIKKR